LKLPLTPEEEEEAREQAATLSAPSTTNDAAATASDDDNDALGAPSDTSLKSLVLSCDAVILDITRDLATSEAILTLLQQQPQLDEPITVVGVSTVMTWDQSRKTKRRGLKEADYKLRKPSLQYANTKVLETLVLNAESDNVRSLVVAPGVLFGRGEDELHELFKRAWLCEAATQTLPIIGDGRNYVPTIHVADLAQVVVASIQTPPDDRRYIVAVDRAAMTQAKLVQALSSGVGTGGVYVPPVSVFL
jgi:adenylate kinase